MDKIIFQRVTDCEYPSLFSIYKKYLKPTIEEALGWNELYQQQRFNQSYQKEWFDWIMYNGERLGIICTKPDAIRSTIHIHLLIVFEKYQNKGVGTAVMKCYQKHYSDVVTKSCLSAFKVNKSVINFYLSLGYQVVREDEHFVEMERSLCFSGYMGES
ncbi:GNAT family N-acetyltransferase [Aliivibrio fischeri]|uniref:GNAT family N-acetyltransferase n=1 Tax=Aliivibrio fischeri TaxID=668 RepID=UPI0012D90DF5|nr:GNAT family N-acetyltransferase [Aliivibrio fischeri]MUK38315.1 GNAT family N-acetyltransferase [Aliivibrio fischeri]MUL02907.1 GNAT family N-acetyltransferase [Aliivibrio fischeri]MUL04904.1 GNAT family N-acetyltransferase [Aliivibrio fischeri]MUL16372.1 GNAT family N-acetyltransferase [Aliivibrio fischeri]